MYTPRAHNKKTNNLILTIGTNNFTPRYLNPRELKTYVHSKSCTQMFIAELFITAKWESQPQYPSVGRGTDKQNVMHSYRKYYSAIKRNGLPIHASICEPWKHYAKWNKSNTKGWILYDSIYVTHLE